MKKEELRKVGWKNQISEGYQEGYFHRWIVKQCGNQFEGIYTDEYALVENKNGYVIYVEAEDIIFIDEFENVNFDNLKQFLGQSLQKDNFEEVLKFIDILSRNELIQRYARDIIQGFKNGALTEIFEIIEELFDTNGDKEKLRVAIEKYGL